MHFQLPAGKLFFQSGSFDLLSVDLGVTNAEFSGTGTIGGDTDPNGNPYKYMVWASDDAVDTLRIRIWWEDTDGTEYDVYDNGVKQAIGGGNIAIHNN